MTSDRGCKVQLPKRAMHWLTVAKRLVGAEAEHAHRRAEPLLHRQRLTGGHVWQRTQ